MLEPRKMKTTKVVNMEEKKIILPWESFLLSMDNAPQKHTLKEEHSHHNLSISN